MFKPTEIIFAATNACNLHCTHCYVNRSNEKLNIEDAKRLLDSCKDSSIYKIGFSGGEPFLYLDFLLEIIKKSVESDFLFDRIMTNGCWWKNEEQLISVLQQVYDAGFDGKIGLSWDSFHGQSVEQITTFIKAVHNIFGPQSIEIQSVININDDFSTFEKLASELNCTIESKLNKKTGRGIIYLQNESINLPIYREPQSFEASDSRAWNSKKWFKDDYCEGPGNIFYVHSNGNIAPCCGFANECPQLTIGNISQDFESIMRQAENNQLVKICFETGLRKELKSLKKKKIKIPGKTQDICAACEWLARSL